MHCICHEKIYFIVLISPNYILVVIVISSILVVSSPHCLLPNPVVLSSRAALFCVQCSNVELAVWFPCSLPILPCFAPGGRMHIWLRFAIADMLHMHSPHISAIDALALHLKARTLCMRTERLICIAS